MSRVESSIIDAIHQLRADYRMGTDSRFHSRLRGVDPSGSGADYHYADERRWLHMLERARFYRREDQIVGQGIRRLVANVVQEGFQPDPQTGDPSVDQKLKNLWYDWTADPDQCDAEGERTFAQIEKMALDAVLTDGDVLFLPLKDGSLQPIEAHRLRTPKNTTLNVVHGVECDSRGRRVRYWITREEIGTRRVLQRVSDVVKYDARDASGERQVIHLYDPTRFSQRRGVTILAPISFTIGAMDDLQFAAIVKAQIGNLIALLRERGPDFNPDGGEAGFGPRSEETINGYVRTMESLGAGLDIAGQPGEKISMFTADVPGPNFRDHSLLILTMIAINLDLPVAVLLLDPSNTNFSGWRGAIDQARIRFRQMQQWFAQAFHARVWRWKVRQWLLQDGTMRAMHEAGKIDVFSHEWRCPSWAYIEPLKDAAADELQDARLLLSKRRIQAARGREWNEVAAEIVADNALIVDMAIREADRINQTHPNARIDWRELLRLPTADRISASIPIGEGSASQEANDDA